MRCHTGGGAARSWLSHRAHSPPAPPRPQTPRWEQRFTTPEENCGQHSRAGPAPLLIHTEPHREAMLSFTNPSTSGTNRMSPRVFPSLSLSHERISLTIPTNPLTLTLCKLNPHLNATVKVHECACWDDQALLD